MRFSFASDLTHELRSVLHGYPSFVFSGNASALANHVPVFVYHGIAPAAFEQDLQFLAEEGYRTIGMDDLVQYLSGKRIEDRAVVLTFDDARSSFWRFGYPLLQRYRMKGVLFVIAGLTLDAPECRSSLTNVWQGGSTLEEVDALDPDDVTLCTWPELEQMHRSGHVEIESHSLFHQEVFVDANIVDFLGPDSSYVPFFTPATAYLSLHDIGRGIVRESLLGLPLFRPAPLHAGLPAFEVPDDVRELAAKIWSEISEQEQRDGGWRRSLRERWRTIDVVSRLRLQTTADVESRITEDIATARDLIKDKVDRAAGDHFCLPYSIGSEITLAAAKRLGIKSCAWGVIPGKKHNAPGTTPMRIGRVKADFLWRLPGKSQTSLARIYGKKIGRRLRRERVY